MNYYSVDSIFYFVFLLHGVVFVLFAGYVKQRSALQSGEAEAKRQTRLFYMDFFLFIIVLPYALVGLALMVNAVSLVNEPLTKEMTARLEDHSGLYAFFGVLVLFLGTYRIVVFCVNLGLYFLRYKQDWPVVSWPIVVYFLYLLFASSFLFLISEQQLRNEVMYFLAI